jgi:hypothetical protein
LKTQREGMLQPPNDILPGFGEGLLFFTSYKGSVIESFSIQNYSKEFYLNKSVFFFSFYPFFCRRANRQEASGRCDGREEAREAAREAPLQQSRSQEAVPDRERAVISPPRAWP